MDRTVPVLDVILALGLVAALIVGGVWLWEQRQRKPPPGGPDGPGG